MASRFLCLLVLVATGLAGDPGPLEALLKDLGSADPHVREAATRKLVEECDARGYDGFRWLDSAAMVPDPEVRKRIATIRRDLELRRKVRALLDVFKQVELPGVRTQKFVRFETESRIGHGWMDAQGHVVDTHLRRVKPLRTAPADFTAFSTDALRRSRETRDRRGDKPIVLERLAFGNVLLSLWTWEKGRKRLAIEYLREANRALQRRNTAQPLSLFVRGRVARMLAERAIRAAIEDEPRPQLVKRWEAVRDVKGPGFVATDFLRAYASLIEEDTSWKEPSPAARRALTPDARAHYWIHWLRDSHASPPALGGPDDPARRLLALGWDAVPALIERLQDTRPLRGADRSSVRLVRYADVASELVARITGRTFQSRGRGEDWWREVERVGVEKYLQDMLADPRRRHVAAGALLQRDAGKHAPGLLALAWKGDPRLLPLLKHHLKDGDRERVARLLKYEGPDGVLAAAQVLWARYEDDTGVRHVVESFKQGDYGANYREQIEFVCASRAPAGIDGVVHSVKGGMPGLQTVFVYHAHQACDPRVLDALLAVMGDRTTHGKLYGRDGRICDRAAWSVARMLRLEKFVLSESVEDRDRDLDRLATWVKAHRATFDWDELRR